MMENKNSKKRIFNLFIGIKEPKKSSCCGNFEIEEIPEGENNKVRKSSCCGNFLIEEIPAEGDDNVTKSAS